MRQDNSLFDLIKKVSTLGEDESNAIYIRAVPSHRIAMRKAPPSRKGGANTGFPSSNLLLRLFAKCSYPRPKSIQLASRCPRLHGLLHPHRRRRPGALI